MLLGSMGTWGWVNMSVNEQTSWDFMSDFEGISWGFHPWDLVSGFSDGWDWDGFGMELRMDCRMDFEGPEENGIKNSTNTWHSAKEKTRIAGKAAPRQKIAMKFDLPFQNGDFPANYVKQPEGISTPFP